MKQYDKDKWPYKGFCIYCDFHVAVFPNEDFRYKLFLCWCPGCQRWARVNIVKDIGAK